MKDSRDELARLLTARAHERARAELRCDWMWTLAEDDEGLRPFGSEAAQRALRNYTDWLDESGGEDAVTFLRAELGRWVPPDGTQKIEQTIDAHGLSSLVRYERQRLTDNDEVVIAVAFAELMLRGRVDPEVRRGALEALRKMLVAIMLDQSYDRHSEPAVRLQEMIRALEASVD